MGRQYEKIHATTLKAAVDIPAGRFISYDGNFPTSSGAGKAVAGVTEHAAMAGEPVSVITGYSAAVEAGGPIAAFTKIQFNSVGQAVFITGSSTVAGLALEAATAAGQFIEVKVLPQ